MIADRTDAGRVLYYAPGAISLAPHLVLHELGIEFTGRRLNLQQNEHKSPAYLAINAFGRVPAFVDGPTTVLESLAICHYLVATHATHWPGSPSSSAAQLRGLQWSALVISTIHPVIRQAFASLQSGELQRSELGRTLGPLEPIVERIDGHLAGNRYAAGGELTVGDYFLLVAGRWCRVLEKPAMSYANLRRFLTEMAARPAVQATFGAEGIDLES